MRITNGILRSESLNGIQRNLRGLREAQTEILTGRRFETASGDPAAASELLSADGRLRSLVQYGRNIGAARARLASEEAVLDQVGDILSRARELAMSQSGATASDQTRAVTLAEVDQLLGAVIQLGNTRHGNVYLFGGQYADVAPFDATGAYDSTREPRGEQRFEIASGQTGAGAHDGWTVFVESDVIESLRALSTALGANDDAAIRASSDRLTNSFDNVQVLLGDVGARSVRLEVAEANIQSLEINLLTLRSDLSEVDLEAAVSKLVSRQSAFEAALLATSRVLSTSLTDYLR